MNSRISNPAPELRPPRRVQQELLDQLPPSDPGAVRSRQDLRRVNAWMGNATIICRMLRQITKGGPPRTIAELGGGDGTVMLEVARRLGPSWAGVQLEIVDRQELVARETVRHFNQIDWRVRTTQSDVFDWSRNGGWGELVIANLFLHHFEDGPLRALLTEVTARARWLVACEPRRFRFARLPGWLLWLIGCNSVTRHDGVASVQAGFTAKELSDLWPDGRNWDLEEAEAGLFCHRLFAQRRET